MTQSRLSCFICIIWIVLIFINTFVDGFHCVRKIPKLYIYSFAGCAVISFLLTLIYDAGIPWMKRLNTLLSGRLSYGQTSIQRFGICLFGSSDLEWVGNGLDMYGEKITDQYLYVDSLYLQVLQRYGILFFLVFMCLVTAVMRKVGKKQDVYLVLTLVVAALHGIIESGIVYLQFNTFWILFGSVLFGNGWQYSDGKRTLSENNRLISKWKGRYKFKL